MKKNWTPLLSIVIFLLTQGVGGAIATLICGNFDSQHSTIAISPEVLAWTTLLTGVVSILVIRLALKSINFKDAFKPSGARNPHNWGTGLIALTGALAALFGINLLSEQLALPNLMEDEFLDMSQSLIGAISIGVGAPIIEELVFRESITGHLLRNGYKPWMAIAYSALAFGIIHINPAQIPFAALIGIVLGILYWRTRNIWLCSIVHIANNSFAVYEMNRLGEKAKDYSYSDMLGGTGMVWTTMVASLLISAALLWMFCRTYKVADNVTDNSVSE